MLSFLSQYTSVAARQIDKWTGGQIAPMFPLVFIVSASRTIKWCKFFSYNESIRELNVCTNANLKLF